MLFLLLQSFLNVNCDLVEFSVVFRDISLFCQRQCTRHTGPNVAGDFYFCWSFAPGALSRQSFILYCTSLFIVSLSFLVCPCGCLSCCLWSPGLLVFWCYDHWMPLRWSTHCPIWQWTVLVIEHIPISLHFGHQNYSAVKSFCITLFFYFDRNPYH